MPQDPVIIPFAVHPDSLPADTVDASIVVWAPGMVTPEVEIPERFFRADEPPLKVVPAPTPVQPFASAWVAIVLLSVFALLAWINVFYRKRMTQVFSAFVSNRFVGQMVREEQAFTNRGSLALDVANLFIVSLFATQAADFYNFAIGGLSGWPLFLLSVGALLGLFLVKLVAVWFSGILFRSEQAMSEYLFNLFLFNNLLSLALLPVVVCLAYFPTIPGQALTIAGGSLFALAFIARIFKAMVLGFGSRSFQGFYIILYICTLEILPLVVLIKVMIR